MHRYRIYGYSVSKGHGDWRYDEFRVTDEGLLEHEIEWNGPSRGDSWLIVANDVHFKWIPRDGAQQAIAADRPKTGAG